MDTIDLLETIGGDASLRYASGEALAQVLEQTQASAELTLSAVQRDGAPLRQEFKCQVNTQVVQTHAPGHEDEDDAPVPERRQPDEAPSLPPAKKPD